MMVILAQEEKLEAVLKLKRKRTREVREARKRRRNEGSGEGEEQGSSVNLESQKQSDSQSETPSLLDIFQSDLDSARNKLQISSPASQKPSFGHRAGFDAFMTGYTFSYYALKLAKLQSSPASLPQAIFSGISNLRGCLGNRGKPLPLRIAKSHFAKTTAEYRELWKSLNKIFNNDSDTNQTK